VAGLWARAADHYREALREDSGSSTLRFKLARMLARLGNWDEAELHLDAAGPDGAGDCLPGRAIGTSSYVRRQAAISPGGTDYQPPYGYRPSIVRPQRIQGNNELRTKSKRTTKNAKITKRSGSPVCGLERCLDNVLPVLGGLRLRL